MDFIHTLGNTVKKARKRLGLTQLKAAEICSIDSRTILNIENYRGNAKMAVLLPLVRGLQIDSQEIFYPGIEIKNPSVSQLRFLIEDCARINRADFSSFELGKAKPFAGLFHSVPNVGKGGIR